MHEPLVPASPRGRAGRYKRWREEALALLNDDERHALVRARAGMPPGVILGPLDASDAPESVAAALTVVEQISRKLLKAYAWPEGDGRHYPPSGYADVLIHGGWKPVGPDWMPEARCSELKYDRGSDTVCPRNDREGAPIEGRPDIRYELLIMVLLCAEARSALDTRKHFSAMLRALALGSTFCRVSSIILDGATIAAGAATDYSREGAHKSLRENFDEKHAARETEIARLDSLTKAKGKRTRAGHIKKALDPWVQRYNDGRTAANHVKTLSVDEISRKLSTRK